MKIGRQIGLVICALLSAWASPAQAQYRFSSWTTDNGLPQNSVNDIRQTRDGYLWLTTFDGLVRFDGVRFTIFDKGNTPGISNNRFLRMYEDGQGDLWAGTEEGGVVRYHQGRFTSYGKDEGLPSLNAYYVTGDAEGHAVVYLANDLVLRFVDGKFQPFNPPKTSLEPSVVFPKEYRRVACPRDGSRIVCVGYGAAGWSEADGLPGLNRVGGDGIDDGRGVLWLAMADGGLVRIEHGKVVRVYNQRDGLPGNPVLFVTGARLSLLSSDQNGGFWLTDIETMQSRPLGSSVPAEVVNPSTKTGYEDREGNLWFATNRAGLFRARRQFITSYSTAEGLTQNNVYPIYQDKDGILWIGTMSGLFRYQDGKFVADDKVKEHIITAIAEDRTGRLIVGGYGKAWLGKAGSLIPIPLSGTGPVWAIYPEVDGTIWFGCEQGLVRFKDGVQTFYKTENGLSGNMVKVMIDDGEGGLWIGTFGGLTHYSQGKFVNWTDRDGLPSRTVRALYRDSEGTLWIGTYDGGLARFKDGKFTRYTAKEGLFNNGVFQILPDDRGNFWISSNHGIFRVSRRELEEFSEGKRDSITSVAYGKADGMLNIECNGGRWPAGTRTRDGKLWFPTQDGVAVIDPAAVPVNLQQPPVMIESLFLDRTPIPLDSEVRIQPNQENFEIQYTALSYIGSEDLRFKYKLEGLDRDWVDAGTRRTAYFSHLRPGRYTFKVIAANRDGVWNMQGASIKLSVLPRFYQTWWFLTLVTFSIAGLGFAAYRMRVRRLQQAHKTQEEFSRRLLQSQEHERQRIAAELHDSLGQSLLIIKNRVVLAQKEIEERETVTEQLGELSHSASLAIDECREIAYNLRPFQLDRFGLSRTLSGIFMRIDQVTEIQATTEIDNIDHLLDAEAQVNVYRIVQECVNNIIKHSRASEALLRVKRHANEITLLVQDNGRGFGKQPVSRASNSTMPPEGKGLGSGNSALAGESSQQNGFGLIGIAERVKMLRGSCEIVSNQGTSIRIRITLREVGE